MKNPVIKEEIKVIARNNQRDGALSVTEEIFFALRGCANYLNTKV